MPKLPRIPKVDVKGRTSRQRLRSIRGKRFRRRFGEELLDSLGFSGSDFQTGGFVKTKLGLFGGAIGGKSKQGAGDIGGLPTLETPRRESNKSNPSLAVILSQFDLLIKSANKLGVLTKQQEKILLNKINNIRKIERESFIENKGADAEALQSVGISPELLAPLASSLENLLQKMGVFEQAIDQKINEQESNDGSFWSRFFDEMGFGEEYDLSKRRRSARQARMQSPEYLKQQRIKTRELRASKFDPELLKSSKGKPLYGAALDEKLKKLESIRKPSLLSRATSNIGSFIGLKSASAVKGGVTNVSALRSSVKKIAGPLISKALGSTTLKSIPIVGAVAGAGFALNRLVQGDPVGAGLDLASGLLGPFTAIPALVASIVRDSYSSIYGVQPEQDPDAPKRIGELKTAVEDLIKQQISPQVDVKKKTSRDQIDNLLIPSQTPKVEQQRQESVSRPPIAPPVKQEQTRSTSRSGASGTSRPSAMPTPPAVPLGTAASGTASAQMLTKPTSSGSQIDQETRRLEQMENAPSSDIVLSGGSKLPTPASNATTRPGAAGMGDVRSPYYDINEMGSIPSQVYY